MGKLVFHIDKMQNPDEFIKLCPFNAMEKSKNGIEATAACKMCKLCVKNAKNGEAEYIEDEKDSQDLSAYQNICVLVDQTEGIIHPVTYELIGKGRELANKAGCKLFCLMIGENILALSQQLLHYPVDEVFVCDHKALRYYRAEPYVAAMEHFVHLYKPSVILVGATTVGRQLAPRAAARFKTGLTADCTILDIVPENCELVQIRPAFGGNIMAEIHTPKNRPQMATVRYKVMDAAERTSEPQKGKVTLLNTEGIDFSSAMEILGIAQKQKEKSIESASVLVVAGRGVQAKAHLGMLQELADLLGGELACTRPLVENGWFEPFRQIGLSGRTVRPQLIITCGVSGAVQFSAGMNASSMIFAINKDKNAPVFEIAHYGIVGDIYEILPELIAQIKRKKEQMQYAKALYD